MIARYKRGTSIRLKNTIRDEDGALYDPATSISVAVYDKDGNELLASTSMVKASIGEYYYDWQVSAGLSYTGFCRVTCTSVDDGSKTSIKDDMEAFELY